MPVKRGLLSPSRTLPREGVGANAEAAPRIELAGVRGVVTAGLGGSDGEGAVDGSAASAECSATTTESGAEGRPLGAGLSDATGRGPRRGRRARPRRARTHARSTEPSARAREWRAARSKARR